MKVDTGNSGPQPGAMTHIWNILTLFGYLLPLKHCSEMKNMCEILVNFATVSY